MPSFISSHHSGGWRYTFHIPVELRPLVKGNKSAYRRYIKRMTRREAETIARSWALEHQSELEVFKGLAPSDRDDLASGGGLAAILNDPRRFLQPPEEQRRKKARAIQERIAKSKPAALALSWDALLNEWIRIKAPARPRNYKATLELLKKHFGQRNCREITQKRNWRLA
jgi:hypothetical protein